MTAPLAISGTEFRGEPTADLVAAARAVGADGVDLWYPENFGDGRDAVAAMLYSAGLDVVCVSSGTELGDAERAGSSVPLLIEAIDVAASLGAPLVNTYFGAPGVLDADRAIDRFCSNIAPCVAHAARRGVTISLENEFDAFGWDPEHGDVTRRPEALQRLAGRFDRGSLQLTFDAANFLCAGASPIEAVDLLKDSVGYVHVKDVVRLVGEEAPVDGWLEFTDGDARFATTWLGAGDVPWDDLFEELSCLPTIRAFTLEPHSTTTLRTDAFEQAVAVVVKALGAARSVDRR